MCVFVRHGLRRDPLVALPSSVLRPAATPTTPARCGAQIQAMFDFKKGDRNFLMNDIDFHRNSWALPSKKSWTRRSHRLASFQCEPQEESQDTDSDYQQLICPFACFQKSGPSGSSGSSDSHRRRRSNATDPTGPSSDTPSGPPP